MTIGWPPAPRCAHIPQTLVVGPKRGLYLDLERLKVERRGRRTFQVDDRPRPARRRASRAELRQRAPLRERPTLQQSTWCHEHGSAHGSSL